MRIQVREFASDKNPLRYLVSVDKPGGLQSEYVVEFKGGAVLVPYLDSYYTEAELSENTLMVDFFDIQALYSISGLQKFERYTDMHYDEEELERLFVEGIAVAILDLAS
ncbi:hypothetical protein [Pantoea cypripedii]|uniref:Uncharacterized protein n=1 Tax=Pantoea cypripedii TaxID=55209 RepID=A0A1X1EMJ7_PANCY|nr:hypothetical protein [Pantoea cypripedii]ORM90043.1 hypothetical protein HA50_26075 [Pantoea cypripedii]